MYKHYQHAYHFQLNAMLDQIHCKRIYLNNMALILVPMKYCKVHTKLLSIFFAYKLAIELSNNYRNMT